jgi:hypothetical protein
MVRWAPRKHQIGELVRLDDIERNGVVVKELRELYVDRHSTLLGALIDVGKTHGLQ